MQFSKEALIKLSVDACTLEERLKGMHTPHVYQDEKQIDTRLEAWCQAYSEGDWDKFMQRLSFFGHTSTSIRPYLGDVALSNPLYLPKWINSFQQITAYYGEQMADESLFVINEPVAFQELFYPFIQYAQNELRARLEGHMFLLTDQVIPALGHGLAVFLSHIYSQTLEVEFSLYRATKGGSRFQFLYNKTDGSQKDIYNAFIAHMLENGLRDLFLDYPVLSRLLTDTSNTWIDATCELITRLHKDYSMIGTAFFNKTGQIGSVANIECGLSDRHHKGRSVAAVTFTSGLKVIYKPKGLQLEQAYFNILEWLNKQNLSLDFKVLKVIDQKDYGWIEYVYHLPCEKAYRIEKYYQRAGMLLALTYALEGSDCHYENIIASGEYPVLIDVETLMHQRTAQFKPQHDYDHQTRYSVLRTGLLPEQNYNEDKINNDLSGFGAQLASLPNVLKWHAINSDAMKRIYGDNTALQLQNQPYIENAHIQAKEHIQSLVMGFSAMYEFLMLNKGILMNKSNPLSQLQNVGCRFIIRATRSYAALLQKSLDSKYLHSGIDRCIQLEQAGRYYNERMPASGFEQVVAHEICALTQLDIPYFYTLSNSKEIYSDNLCLTNEIFHSNAFSCLTEKLSSLNADDLAIQLLYINSAFRSC